MSSRKTWMLRIAAVLALAIAGAVLAHFSAATHPRFHNLPSSVDSQQAILERRLFHFEDYSIDYPSWRNRVAIPLAMKATSALLGCSPSQAYLLVRWLSACLALTAFAWLVRIATRATFWLCGFAALAFALSLFPTFLHIYEVPSDFLDAATFSLLIGCVLQKQRVTLVVALFLSLLNRESGLFALFAWWAVHAWPFERGRFLRESIFCSLVGVSGTATLMFARVANAVPGINAQGGAEPFNPAATFQTHARQLASFLTHPNYSNPLFYHLGFIAVVALIVLACWSDLPVHLRRLGGCGVAIYFVSLFFGNIDELRCYIPTLVVYAFLIAWLALRPASAPAPA